MSYKYFYTLGLVALACCFPYDARASMFGYEGTFSVAPGGGISLAPTFDVTSSDETGVIGDNGTITGSFQMGTVSGTSAPITGLGTIQLFDGLGGTFTSTATSLEDITLEAATSSIGAFDFEGVADVTGITYTGSVPGVADLAKTGAGILTASLFLTSGSTNLNGLETNGGGGFYVATFTAAAPPGVPEPGTAYLGGMGVLAAAVLTRRKRSTLST